MHFPGLGGEESVQKIVSTGSLKFFFWTGYGILFAWTLVLLFGLILKPSVTKRVLLLIFSLPFLKRWRWSAREWARDLEIAANTFKGKPLKFWLKAYGATFLSWTTRYLMVNFLMLAFGPVSSQLLVYGRQLVMWVILIVAVTPGGSGVAEIIFPAFLGEFLPERHIAGGVALLWRILSYYPYLIIGTIVLPMWLRRIRKEKNEIIPK